MAVIDCSGFSSGRRSVESEAEQRHGDLVGEDPDRESEPEGDPQAREGPPRTTDCRRFESHLGETQN
jgi:hypothetical protein